MPSPVSAIWKTMRKARSGTRSSVRLPTTLPSIATPIIAAISGR